MPCPILSPTYVGYLAWGTKDLVIDGVNYPFPRLSRRKTLIRIWKDFISWCNMRRHIGKTSFFNILNELTCDSTRIVRAVDYVTGFLVNDTINNLSRIMLEFTSSERRREDYSRRIAFCKNFLKYVYNSHLRKECEALTHSITHGLSTDSEQALHPSCLGCKAPFKLVDDIMDECIESSGADESVKDVLLECRTKFHLFMGHRIRVTNQQMHIQKIHDDIRASCPRRTNGSTTKGILLVDFKMKFESLYFREKTVENYGKRGISWHGAMVMYYSWDVSHGAAIRNNVYIDDLIVGSNKQGTGLVISIIEAIMMRIKKDIPHMKEVVLQSDNAKCYMSKELLLCLALLSFIHGIKILRFIHTETQDGKSPLDGHFARANKWIVDWVKEGNNALTAAQIVTALKSNGGIPNEIPQLDTYNNPRMMSLLGILSPMVKNLSKHIGRMNDVIFQYPDEFESSVDIGCFSERNFDAVPEFSLICFEYSGIGKGEKFEVNMKRRMVCSSSVETVGNHLSREEKDGTESGSCSGSESEEVAPVLNQDEEEETELLYGLRERGRDASKFSMLGCLSGIGVVSDSTLNKIKRRWKKVPDSTAEAVPSMGERRDLISHAKRCALELKHSGRFHVEDGKADSEEWMAGCESYVFPVSFGTGWARRPKNGQMYGKKYIERYRDEIIRMFQRGAEDSSEKCSAPIMWEHLVMKFPDRYDIPSEQEIRQEIGRLYKLKKDNRDLQLSRPGRRGRKGMDEKYERILLKFLEENPNLKPRKGYQMFLNHFEDPNVEGFPTEKQVKSKISSLKSAAKNS